MTHRTSKKLIGYAMYATCLILPLSNYPQIQQLYVTKVASGLSLSTWVMYLVFGLVPLAYALANKLGPLIVSNVLWTIVNVVMIAGIIRYGVFSSSGFEQLLVINNIGKGLNGLGLLCLSMACALFAYDFLETKRAARGA